MALQMSAHMMRGLEQLRYQPTPKRIRASLRNRIVVDSTRAVLIWEPRRVVPTYGVPVEDVLAELVPDGTPGPQDPAPGRPFLAPNIGFEVHTADGEPLTLRDVDGDRVGAAFRLADPELAAYAVLDFQAFDAWLEEDEPIVGHPHDPYGRIDVRRSSRRLRVEVDGVVLADSSRAQVVFETHMPARHYVPREDVLAQLLPSPTTTTCAYKGHASYWSVDAGGHRIDDIAWSYEQPLQEMSVLTGLVCFFAERTDVTLDGRRQDRPQTRWARSAGEG